MKVSAALKRSFSAITASISSTLKVARIFNTYGPRMPPNDGRVVSNFVVQALRGEPITIYGDGYQTRSFCYVDNLIEGIVKLMNSPTGITGPINFGNPGEFTVRELAELTIELTGSPSKLVFLPFRADDPRKLQPRITRAKEQLGWQPSIPLREGLGHTISYFDQLLSEGSAVLPASSLKAVA
jgi:UDP-glucuronate decarboxylase